MAGGAVLQEPGRQPSAIVDAVLENDVFPSVDDTYWLGTTTKGWKGVHFPDLKLYQLDADTLSLENTAGGTYKNLLVGSLGAGITPSNRLHARETDAANTTVLDVLRVDRITSHASHGGDGIGAGIVLYSEDGSGNIEEAGRINALFTTAAHATQAGRVDITAMGGTTGIHILSTGLVGIGVNAPNYMLTVRAAKTLIDSIAPLQAVIDDTTAFASSPQAGLGFRVKQNATSYFLAGSLAGFKENVTEDNYGGGLVFYVARNATGMREAARFNSEAAFLLGGVGTEPSLTADQAGIYAMDLAADRRSLGFTTEEAVAADVILASTHTWQVRINGVTYKVLLST